MAIFKKKQTRVYIPNKINATTRLSSLYGDDANIRYLEDRINNMRNVDAYTRQESDNRFARLTENNTFTNNQTIKGGSAFVEFKGTDNNRKGYVGKPSSTSNDMELKAETNSLTLSANHHVIIKPGSNYQARYEKTPTEGVEIANKTYVDTKTGANKTILDRHENSINENRNNIEAIIQTFDKIPRTDRRNTFIEDNNFLGTITTSKVESNQLECDSSIINTVNTNNDKSGVNIKYLNDRLKQFQPSSNVALTNKENTFTEQQTVKANLKIQNTSNGYSDIRFYKSDGTTKYGEIGLAAANNEDFIVISTFGDLVLKPMSGKKVKVTEGPLNMDSNKIVGLASPTISSDAANMGYVNTRIDTLDRAVTQRVSEAKDYAKSVSSMKKIYKNIQLKFNKVHIASGAFMYGSYGMEISPFSFGGLLSNQRYEIVMRLRRVSGKRINLFLKAIEVTSNSSGYVEIPRYSFEDSEVVFMWNVDLRPGGSGDTGYKNCEVGILAIPIK